MNIVVCRASFIIVTGPVKSASSLSRRVKAGPLWASAGTDGRRHGKAADSAIQFLFPRNKSCLNYSVLIATEHC